MRPWARHLTYQELFACVEGAERFTIDLAACENDVYFGDDWVAGVLNMNSPGSPTPAHEPFLEMFYPAWVAPPVDAAVSEKDGHECALRARGCARARRPGSIT